MGYKIRHSKQSSLLSLLFAFPICDMWQANLVALHPHVTSKLSWKIYMWQANLFTLHLHVQANLVEKVIIWVCLWKWRANKSDEQMYLLDIHMLFLRLRANGSDEQMYLLAMYRSVIWKNSVDYNIWFSKSRVS